MITRKSISKEIDLIPKSEFFAIAIVGGKTNENFGSILRLALNYNASAIFLVNCRYRRVNTDTMHTAKSIPVIETTEIPKIVGVKHVYIEITENAIPLDKFDHPKQALYIVGPEDGSLIVPKEKTAVYVPTIGSMNQAMTVCTVLWDRYLKLKRR